MIRQLCDLNAADAREELRGVGYADGALPEAAVRDMQKHFAIQVAGFDLPVLKTAAAWLERRAGSRIYARWGGQKKPGFIACGPVERFAGLTDSVAVDELSGFGRELQQFFENISRKVWHYQIPGGVLKIERPLVMGILNVTPDSFSDGGRFFSVEEGYRQAQHMLAAGAAIIDIGGESTRPGAREVSISEEWARVAPVIQRLAKTPGCIISIDTYKSEIARRAVAEGAHIINDISGGRFDPAILAVAAEHNIPMVLMHIQGQPRTMQQNPSYRHLMAEIFADLAQKCHAARTRGVTQLMVDPGIGFGKRYEDNYEILRRLREFAGLGYPVLLGASRKSFLGRLLNAPVTERLLASVTGAVVAALNGATILRVHDVAETCQALTVLQAIQALKSAEEGEPGAKKAPRQG